MRILAFITLLLLSSPVSAQCIYNCGGGIYPQCQDVLVCQGGQCQTVHVCR